MEPYCDIHRLVTITSKNQHFRFIQLMIYGLYYIPYRSLNE